MSTPNVDDLFSQIDGIAEKMEQSEKENKKSGGKKGGKTNFKNLDMTFLGAPRGTYELKVIVDGTGALSEEIYLHSVKTQNAKVTLPCAGEECEICKRQAKLEELGNKAAWKFRKYKLNKILVKIGDIPEGAKSLNAGSVYVAYVDDKYFKPLIDTIRTNKKYYKDDIAKMLDPAKRSGGFLVTAAKSGKSVTYNFNFIPTIDIANIDIKEVFGNDNFKIANFGYFRNNYMPEEKLKQAISIMDTIILNTVDKKKGTPSGDKSGNPESGDKTDDQKSDQKVDTTTTTDAKVEGSEGTANLEESTKTTEEIPTKTVEEEVPQTDGKPECFTKFDPSDSKCSEKCQYKRDCLMAAMDAGNI